MKGWETRKGLSKYDSKEWIQDIFSKNSNVKLKIGTSSIAVWWNNHKTPSFSEKKVAWLFKIIFYVVVYQENWLLNLTHKHKQRIATFTYVVINNNRICEIVNMCTNILILIIIKIIIETCVFIFIAPRQGDHHQGNPENFAVWIISRISFKWTEATSKSQW